MARLRRHTPELLHSRSSVSARASCSPALGLVSGDPAAPLAEGSWASQSQEEERFGGRLSPGS